MGILIVKHKVRKMKINLRKHPMPMRYFRMQKRKSNTMTCEKITINNLAVHNNEMAMVSINQIQRVSIPTNMILKEEDMEKDQNMRNMLLITVLIKMQGKRLNKTHLEMLNMNNGEGNMKIHTIRTNKTIINKNQITNTHNRIRITTPITPTPTIITKNKKKISKTFTVKDNNRDKNGIIETLLITNIKALKMQSKR